MAVIVALVGGPEATRAWLVIPGLAAIALSVSSVVAEPRELLAALVLGATPAMGLADQDALQWLIGPVAVLLLIGAELNAWSWELVGHDPTGRDHRRRLSGIARSAATGLAASLGVSLAARSTLLDGLAAVALASAALAGLGWILLPGGGRGRDGRHPRRVDGRHSSR
jgi:hypothetical protein